MDFKTVYNRDFTIISILDKGVEIGSIELIQMSDAVFVENVFLVVEHRNKGHLREIIEYLSDQTIKCLPLPEHIPKFEHLGFKPYKHEGEDIYYIK